MRRSEPSRNSAQRLPVLYAKGSFNVERSQRISKFLVFNYLYLFKFFILVKDPGEVRTWRSSRHSTHIGKIHFTLNDCHRMSMSE